MSQLLNHASMSRESLIQSRLSLSVVSCREQSAETGDLRYPEYAIEKLSAGTFPGIGEPSSTLKFNVVVVVSNNFPP